MRTIDAHFKLAKRCDKQRALIPSCIKFCLSELKKASMITEVAKQQIFIGKKHKA